MPTFGMGLTPREARCLTRLGQSPPKSGVRHPLGGSQTPCLSRPASRDSNACRSDSPETGRSYRGRRGSSFVTRTISLLRSPWQRAYATASGIGLSLGRRSKRTGSLLPPPGAEDNPAYGFVVVVGGGGGGAVTVRVTVFVVVIVTVSTAPVTVTVGPGAVVVTRRVTVCTTVVGCVTV